MEKKQKKIFVILITAAILIAVLPFLTLKDASFGGSDDAGSAMARKINKEYEPWFEPVLESLIGGEIPGEIESLLFCIQTGIGVGIIAFYMGRLYERRKLGMDTEKL
ncbi:MAG: cobalt transport protein CbiN [Dorea sp.]|jgi:cobalt/nickel transport protein|nr:cobalt transport protein CbiN [Dorea sp.]